MRKLLVLVLIVCAILSIPVGKENLKNNALNAVKDIKNENLTLLVCGLDESELNTDVMFLVNYNYQSNSCNVLQIPRDTYYSYSYGNCKINGIHAIEMAKSKNRFKAMEVLGAEMEQSLKINIDGFISLNMDSFKSILDSIPNFEFYMPKDICLDIGGGETLDLKKGSNKINSQEALKLIRHRKTYQRGDLKRLDVQKYFLYTCFENFRKNSDTFTLIKLLSTGLDGVATNLDFGDIVKIFMKNSGRNEEMSIKFATLPGEDMIYQGVSYYLMNRYASENLLKDFSFRNVGYFDFDRRFEFNKDEKLKEVYSKNNINYKIYDSENIMSVFD